MKPDVEMTFGEHLDELRRRVIRALIGLAITTAACAFFYQDIFNALALPYEQASRDLADRIEAEHRPPGTDPATAPPLPEDIQEQVRRLRYPRIIPGSPTTLFTTLIVLCVTAAGIAASPWIIYQIWAFVGVGLHSHERRFLYIYGPFSFFLFIGGAAFSFLVLRFALQALMGIGSGIRAIEHTYTLDGYIRFLAWMAIAFGIAFQTPLVVLFLARTGIVPLGTLVRQQRFVILLLVVISALLSPGTDPVTMLFMAVPLITLYQVGLLLAWLGVRKQRREESALEGGLVPWDDPGYDTQDPPPD